MSDKVERGWEEEDTSHESAVDERDTREGLTATRLAALTPVVYDSADYWVSDSEWRDTMESWVTSLDAVDCYEEVSSDTRPVPVDVADISTYDMWQHRPKSPGWNGKHTPWKDSAHWKKEDEEVTVAGDAWQERDYNALYEHEGKRFEKALLRAKRAEKKRATPEPAYFADYGVRPSPGHVQGWNAQTVKPAIHKELAWGPPPPPAQSLKPATPFAAPFRRASPVPERSESTAEPLTQQAVAPLPSAPPRSSASPERKSKGKERATEYDDFWSHKLAREEGKEAEKAAISASNEYYATGNKAAERNAVAEEQHAWSTATRAAEELREVLPAATSSRPSSNDWLVPQSAPWPVEQSASKASSANEANWQPRIALQSTSQQQQQQPLVWRGRGAWRPSQPACRDLDAWLDDPRTYDRYKALAWSRLYTKEQVYQMYREQEEYLRWIGCHPRDVERTPNNSPPEFPFERFSRMKRNADQGLPPRRAIYVEGRPDAQGNFEPEPPERPGKKKLMFHACTQTAGSYGAQSRQALKELVHHLQEENARLKAQ